MDSEDLTQTINAGQKLLKQQRYAEALEAFERALALGPKQASVWSREGITLLGLQRYEEAREAYRFARFTAIWYGGTPAYRRRAEAGYLNALLRLGRYREAFKTYRDDRRHKRRVAKKYGAFWDGDEGEAEDWPTP